MVVLRSFALVLFIYAVVALKATVSQNFKGRELMMSNECSMLSMLQQEEQKEKNMALKRPLLYSRRWA